MEPDTFDLEISTSGMFSYITNSDACSIRIDFLSTEDDSYIQIINTMGDGENFVDVYYGKAIYDKLFTTEIRNRFCFVASFCSDGNAALSNCDIVKQPIFLFPKGQYSIFKFLGEANMFKIFMYN